ncbi:MAG: DnaA family protein [Alphaproteobacteria bacterium]|jgi:DnaA family protein
MQLILPVSFRKQDSLENFVEGENSQLLSHVQDVLANQVNYPHASQRICVVTGSVGAGKSHLLLAISEQASLNGLTQQYVDLAQIINMPPEMLLGLINKDVLCIDNLQSINAISSWQTAIFDTINQFTEAQGKLLLIATSKPIDEIEYTLADLRTRLSWGTNYALHPLNDADKCEALENHLKAIRIGYTEDAIGFLLNRTSRNMRDLRLVIDALDKASLESKRKITIPFIKSTLGL